MMIDNLQIFSKNAIRNAWQHNRSFINNNEEYLLCAPCLTTTRDARRLCFHASFERAMKETEITIVDAKFVLTNFLH